MSGRGRCRRVFVAYLLLLVGCALWRQLVPLADPPPLPAGMRAVPLPLLGSGAQPVGPHRLPVTLAWREWHATPPAVTAPAGTPAAGTSAAAAPQPVVLLHGSPGSHRDFAGVGPRLAELGRSAYAPDLPGFGASSRRIPDYSIATHARYVAAWLDHELGAARPVHVVGFSLGGGVAIELAGSHPERVASLTLLSATGVQELELLGDARLNRAVHALQLGLLEAVRWGVPHLGALDRTMLGPSYARNFYDSDQRPLRGILQRVAMPVLILHGTDDPLVPVVAALEHRRIVPQSELVLLPTDHFHVFREPSDVAARVASFADRVEASKATTRASAEPTRLTAAAQPFDAHSLPPLSGLAAVITGLLLAAATFVSEDLATIGAGLLVAHGRLGFWAASFACFLGIFVGDLLLFVAGRLLGRRALRLPPLSWWLSEDTLARSSAWLRRRGAAVVFLSRLIPGTRLPTYVGAGVLHTPFWRFTAYFALACAVWSPLLVLAAWWLGATAMSWLAAAERHLLLLFVVVIVGVVALRAVLIPLFSWEGRRKLLGRIRRFTQWEFWPPWLFYPPVVVYLAFLALRYRGATVFTAANPGIPSGGFIGESKADILRALAGADRYLPRWELLEPATLGPDGEPSPTSIGERVAAVERFRVAQGLDWPLVLKPNVGQRGSGVAVVRSIGQVETYFARTRVATLVQEHVPGVEVGLFYIRHPETPTGRIFSVTLKELPHVVGDGVTPLEDLILRDDRAIAMADFYLERQGTWRWHVPAPGERVPLVELGTHCRGAIFRDGAELVTPALEAAVEEISRAFSGFHFGRYDVRTPSLEALSRGELRIIELNGVTSEATSIYDPRHSVWFAWRTLFEQWRLAFAIGAWHRDRGVRPSGALELLRGVLAYRRAQRDHPAAPTTADAMGATAGHGEPESA